MKPIFKETIALEYHTGTVRQDGRDDNGDPAFVVDYDTRKCYVCVVAHYDHDQRVYVADGSFESAITGKEHNHRELMTIDTEAQAIRRAIAFADQVQHMAQQCIPLQPTDEDIIDAYKAKLNNPNPYADRKKLFTPSGV